jgi:hypothetical protein
MQECPVEDRTLRLIATALVAAEPLAESNHSGYRR